MNGANPPAFVNVTEVDFRFCEHTTLAGVRDVLNGVYGDTITDGVIIDQFFTDATRTTVVPNIVNVVKGMFRDEIFAPIAIQTTDANRFDVVLHACPVMMEIQGRQPSRLRGAASLITVLRQLLRDGGDKITLSLQVNGITFDQRNGPNNYLDFGSWSTIPIQNNVVPAQAAAVIAAAGGGGGGGGPVHNAPGAIPAGNYFNHRSLVADVQARYLLKKSGEVILGNQVTKFDRIAGQAQGFWYAQDGTTGRLVLADGTFWPANPLDEKSFLKELPPCKGNTPSEIRAWHEEFLKHAYKNGIYIHPILCHRKDFGGQRGFTVGNDHEDSLPARMETQLDTMAGIIYNALLRKDVFPEKSAIYDLIKRQSGDGYESMYAIMFHALPIYNPLAATTCTEYPEQQKGQNSFEFHHVYMDFLRMRAWILNVPASLNNKDQMDIYMSKQYYSAWLTQVTRNERADVTQAYRYTEKQIAHTLSMFLILPDSPARNNQDSHGSRSSRSSPSTSIMNVAHRYRGGGYSKGYDPDRSTKHAVNNLYYGNNPFAVLQDDDSEDESGDESMYQDYHHAILAIKSDPKNMDKRPCIVCGGRHTFSDCGVLGDHEYLKSHYIGFCQQMRRESELRAQTFSGEAGTIPGVDRNGKNNGGGKSDKDFQTGRD